MARTLHITAPRHRAPSLPRLSALLAGLSAEEARREPGKPIWDIPAHWRR